MADVINQAKAVGATFTSWDSCMSKTYCKWPVIAAIIIGSLIVLSILWCIFSCLCCGISICTACTRCLTCGGCCGACGSSRGRRKDAEYQAMPPTPTPYQGYQPQPHPMMYNGNGPQFATFDTGNKRGANIHEDSLPAMPSWQNATTRRVEDPEYTQQQQRRREDMEMESMLPHGQAQRSPVPHSPVHDSPYASDLGTQNLASRNGHTNDYYDAPMSPAPTYYSTAPANAAFASGARAISPQHTERTGYMSSRAMSPESTRDSGYNNAQAMSPQHTQDTSYNNTGGFAPYPASRESTQFGSGYTTSPYYQQQQRQSPPPQPPQQQQYDSGSGVRPPSLLQVGRKPVPGAYREV